MSEVLDLPETLTQIRSPWPKVKDVPGAFGAMEFGTEGLPTDRWRQRFTARITAPYHMRLAWKLEQGVRHIVCNRAVRHSLADCLALVAQFYGHNDAALQEARVDRFGGCYAFGIEKGQPSPEAWGISIRMDPEGNPDGRDWKEGMIPMAAVEIFERAGWQWGGRWDWKKSGFQGKLSGGPKCSVFRATCD